MSGLGRIDGPTYAEGRADLDRAAEALWRDLRETEARISKRLDEERGAASELEQRVRASEQELATLRTTNRLIAAAAGALVALMGLALTALSRWR